MIGFGRWLIRGLSLAGWAIWVWLNLLGCGSFAPACPPANPLAWPLSDFLSLLLLPGALVLLIWVLTRSRAGS